MLVDERAWWALREARDLIAQAEKGLRHEGDAAQADQMLLIVEGLDTVERALQNQPMPKPKRRFLG